MNERDNTEEHAENGEVRMGDLRIEGDKNAKNTMMPKNGTPKNRTPRRLIPMVISKVQKKFYTLDEVFSLTRIFCYGIHCRRLHLLGKFNSFLS